MQLAGIQTKLYRKLNTPAKLQDFINELTANFELLGETCRSPLRVIQDQTAHCLEGAMLAASVLRFHGAKPLLLDLRAKRPDDDHVVALFRLKGGWGAISKTNHAVLRYREPIYRTLRELALSYFHEYFDDQGNKNLREYSKPFSLARFDPINWETTLQDLWVVVKSLDHAQHLQLLSRSEVKNLRKAERIEIQAGKLLEWDKQGQRQY
jgi:hypothetical protein